MQWGHTQLSPAAAFVSASGEVGCDWFESELTVYWEDVFMGFCSVQVRPGSSGDEEEIVDC